MKTADASKKGMTMVKTKYLGEIRDLLPDLQKRVLPLVNEMDTVDEIIDAYALSFHSRLIYVVDKDRKLIGIISLGNLLRHVFFHYHDSCMDTDNLINMAVSEHARDFTTGSTLTAEAHEDVETVLQRMIKYNVKEIPIVDENKRVIADLTMVDILHHYRKNKKQKAEDRRHRGAEAQSLRKTS